METMVIGTYISRYFVISENGEIIKRYLFHNQWYSLFGAVSMN
jgi:hypothetical protein